MADRGPQRRYEEMIRELRRAPLFLAILPGDQAVEAFEERLRFLRRQHRRRLVEDQHLGAAVERLQDLDALLLAERELPELRARVDGDLVALAELLGDGAGEQVSLPPEREAGRCQVGEVGDVRVGQAVEPVRAEQHAPAGDPARRGCEHDRRRELAQGLAEGVRTHLADLRRRFGLRTRTLLRADFQRVTQLTLDPAQPSVALSGPGPSASQNISKYSAISHALGSAACAWIAISERFIITR